MTGILEKLKMENIEKIEFVFENVDFLFVDAKYIDAIFIGDIGVDVYTCLNFDGYHSENTYTSDDIYIYFNSGIIDLNYENIGKEIKNVEERLSSYQDICIINFHLNSGEKISIVPRWRGPDITNYYQKYDSNRKILSIDTLNTTNQQTCKNCKWHDDFTWVCFNVDSQYKNDTTDDEFECECFKDK